MKQFRAALVSATALLSLASAAVADAVTLTSLDGAIELSGTILDFDGVTYRIGSEYGELTVSADMVTCAGATCPKAGAFVAEWVISGARPGADVLLPALLEAFAEQEGLALARQSDGAGKELYAIRDAMTGAELARVRIRASSAAEGFADIADKSADMAIAAREPEAQEVASVSDAGLGQITDPAQSRLLALDALVAVVHPAADRDAVTADELAGLLARPTGTPVHLSKKVAGHGALAAWLPERTEATIGDSVRRHASARELAAALLADSEAMGVAMLSDADGLHPLALQGSCGVQVAPGLQAVKAEDYPLTIAHYLYLPRGRLPAIARRFVAFATSEAAQAAVRAAGFVDRSIDATPFGAQGERLGRAVLATGEEVSPGDLRRMVGALAGAARLTPTFRFQDGSAELDRPSRANIELVAQAIAGGAFDGGELLVVGFSDGMGGAAGNLALSRERAAVVRAAIEAALTADARARVDIDDQGFGEALPTACDEDDWGRSVNRRVEIWLRQR